MVTDRLHTAIRLRLHSQTLHRILQETDLLKLPPCFVRDDWLQIDSCGWRLMDGYPSREFLNIFGAGMGVEEFFCFVNKPPYNKNNKSLLCHARIPCITIVSLQSDLEKPRAACFKNKATGNKYEQRYDQTKELFQV